MDPRYAHLLTELASPEAHTRDDKAFNTLAELIAKETNPTTRTAILEHATCRLATAQASVWEKSFLTLILSCLCESGTHHDHAYTTMRQWYLTEEDTRGYDPEIGWIHAIAHGADYLASLVTHHHLAPNECLETISLRLLGPGGAYTAHEDARLARTALISLAALSQQPNTRPEDINRWLKPIEEKLSTSTEFHPWQHNTAITLNAILQGLPENTPNQHFEAVRESITRITHQIRPYATPLT
ncbi:DUF2785 domain-containing protein [Corynebacterium aquilae]|uniref:DUF2785 domain-containing protein n=1 Tax=Corynebacterium aquilae TaxID=203263 RepID=UPI00095112BB|nr:DUF2785 domain-containing protein [Corynebacterium aquilae]